MKKVATLVMVLLFVVVTQAQVATLVPAESVELAVGYHGEWNASTRMYQVIMKTAGADPAFSYNKDIAYFYWQFGIKRYAIYDIKAVVYRLDVKATGKTWKVADSSIGKMNFSFPNIDLWQGYWYIGYSPNNFVSATLPMPGFYKMVGAISTEDGVEISKITSYFDVY